MKSERVKSHSALLAEVQMENQKIVGLTLANGKQTSGSLYIDCTGPKAELISAIVPENTRTTSRELFAVQSFKPTDELGPAYRHVKSLPNGWQSTTPLKNGVEQLTALDIDEQNSLSAYSVNSNDKVFSISTGARTYAWLENCVAIGQSANTIEPLTPAPMMMLVADIQRLLELIPVTSDMQVEAKEYNRRYSADAEHTDLFHGALYNSQQVPKTKFWQSAMQSFQSEKLTQKLQQFTHRGLLVNFDLEPFNEQDWLIMHLGMGRYPKHYDRLAEQISKTDVKSSLNKMKSTIEAVVSKMPPHAIYMEKLSQYLKRATN